MDNLADIGLIGLGTMGANYSRNMASNGFTVSVFNRTVEKTTEFIAEHGSKNLQGYIELSDFIASIRAPRKIIILVKAGAPVDETIASILPLLESGDTIIDFGNSKYTDTIRREQELAKKGLYFFGCGISGGEEGALRGPSLMPGGSSTVWRDLEPILTATAAKDFNGNACVTYVGPNGAGHYVKMVHNGIEYAVMQMMAEAYQILRDGYAMPAPVIADIFEYYSTGRLSSFLFDITLPILRKRDEDDTYLLDKIVDAAGQKGTGTWTAIDSLEQAVPLSVITEAVYARIMSSNSVNRTMYSTIYSAPVQPFTAPKEQTVQALENALYAGMLIAYAQGMQMITHMSNQMHWNINIAEVVRIWQGGCIIRAKVLHELHASFLQRSNDDVLMIPAISQSIQTNLPSLRWIVARSAEHGVPLPSFSAALSYIETMTKSRGSANFLQALRDSFGAHTYERIDKPGSFHTHWS